MHFSAFTIVSHARSLLDIHCSTMKKISLQRGTRLADSTAYRIKQLTAILDLLKRNKNTSHVALCLLLSRIKLSVCVMDEAVGTINLKVTFM